MLPRDDGDSLVAALGVFRGSGDGVVVVVDF